MAAHEFSLIGNRMTWFAISQSFLFSTYVTIATDPSRLQLIDPTKTEQVPGKFTTMLMLLCIPIVGMLFAFTAWLGVCAAGRVLNKLMECRGECLKKINSSVAEQNILIPVIGSEEDRRGLGLSSTVMHGDMPMLALPLGMMLIWLFCLGIRFDWSQIGESIKALGPT
jgi:hypothetical protein